MNTTLSAHLVQRLRALQGELIAAVAADLGGLSPKLEQLIRVLEWSRIESLVHGPVGGRGQPPADRRALACAFMAKAVLGISSTRALIERLQVDGKLRRICGFEMHRVLPSEATFSRAFDEFARSELAARAHERMIRADLGQRLIGHVSRDATAIEARERVASTPAPTPPVRRQRGRPRKGEQRIPVVGAVERQSTQTLAQMLAELPRQCSVGTKTDAKGHPHRWRGYKLHLDTACCGVIVSAVLTGAAVHDSRVALPLSLLTAERVQPLYELMDAAYCSTTIRQHVTAQGRVALIDHNPRGGAKIEFAPHEAQRYKTRSGAERSNARLKDEFGARAIYVRGATKVMSHLMFGVVALCADQLMRLLQ